jgi:hypothetical protein
MRYWFGNTGHPQTDYGSDFSGWRDFWQDMMAATVIDPKGLEERTILCSIVYHSLFSPLFVSITNT